MKRFFLLILTWAAALFFSFAQQLSPSAEISLISCAPGEQLYSKFGHTAIRVYDPQQHIDLTFNYGMFSFYSDHFYYRFVKGETDYMLGLEPTNEFQEQYDRRNRAVYEQVLNLSESEKDTIFKALLINYLPENRTYRYNFVYDNCATRPYYLLKNNLTGILDAPEFSKRSDTYRNIIAYYTNPNSWAFFGISLIFGADADHIMQPEERLFLPEELMNFASEASIVSTDSTRKLVLRETVSSFPVEPTGWLQSTSPVLWLLVIVFIAVCLTDIKKRKIHYGFDAFIYLIIGLLGIITCYLSFFSLHPMVKHNYNLLFINPLFLILFVFTLFKKGRNWLNHIQFALLCYYTVACIVWLTSPQEPHIFVLLIEIMLMIRSVMIWRQKSIPKPSKNTKKTLIIICLLAIGESLSAQTPRLVVQVVIDGLHQQNLDMMENYFSTGGFQLLQKEAYYATEMEFPQLINGGCESVATLCTGTTPYYHGISSEYFFNRTDRRIHHSLEDISQIGIGTDLCISAKSLLTNTVTDELRLKNGNKSKIYAVGIDAATTILLAGHSANGAIWIDDKKMCWASTGYYPEGLSQWADEMNVNERFTEISAREWTPRLPYNMYLFPNEREIKNKGFSYIANQPQSKNNTQTILKTSPSANALVIELALKIQENEKLGMDIIPDMLMIELSCVTPDTQSDIIASAEQEDMYICLNQDLGYLLEQLTKRIGKDHMLVVVTGKPNKGRSVQQLRNEKISTGEFNIGRAAALTNTYLMAIYGHERWIDGGYDRYIYLNRPLLEQKKMSLTDMQNQVANFLIEFEGVQSAYTAAQISLLPSNGHDALNQLRNSCNKRSYGDIMYTAQPGWSVVDERNKVIDNVTENSPSVPLFIWGMNIIAKRDATPTDATAVAPIICKWLHLPLPNGAFPCHNQLEVETK